MTLKLIEVSNYYMEMRNSPKVCTKIRVLFLIAKIAIWYRLSPGHVYERVVHDIAVIKPLIYVYRTPIHPETIYYVII